jgi:hypothetical protein
MYYSINTQKNVKASKQFQLIFCNIRKISMHLKKLKLSSNVVDHEYVLGWTAKKYCKPILTGHFKFFQPVSFEMYEVRELYIQT